MKAINLYKASEKLDLKTGLIMFSVSSDEPIKPGVVVPEDDNVDKLIMNPLYVGGELLVKMRVLSTPARKYEVGDKIASLVVLDVKESK